jgi:hypothetical protein
LGPPASHFATGKRFQLRPLPLALDERSIDAVFGHEGFEALTNEGRHRDGFDQITSSFRCCLAFRGIGGDSEQAQGRIASGRPQDDP